MNHQFWDDYVPDCPDCKGYERKVLRLEDEVERLQNAISDVLPALEMVNGGEWHEYTGDLVLKEHQWGLITTAAKELRALVSQ